MRDKRCAARLVSNTLTEHHQHFVLRKIGTKNWYGGGKIARITVLAAALFRGVRSKNYCISALMNLQFARAGNITNVQKASGPSLFISARVSHRSLSFSCF